MKVVVVVVLKIVNRINITSKHVLFIWEEEK